MAKSKTEPAFEWEEVGIGDQVEHPKWGLGTVLFRSGAGETAKAVVVFPEQGQVKLMLKYAKLKRIGAAPKSELAKAKAALRPPARPQIAPPIQEVEPVEDEGFVSEEPETGKDPEAQDLDSENYEAEEEEEEEKKDYEESLEEESDE